MSAPSPKPTIIRRKRDGTVTVEGPDEQIFSARQVARQLGDLISVTVRVGPRTYAFEGFEPILDANGEQAFETNVVGVSDEPVPKYNFTAWKLRLIESADQSGDYESAPELEEQITDG